MKIIYEPKGRAREYSELACNLSTGCTHGCTYCYARQIMRKSPEQWQKIEFKKDALELLEKDAKEMQEKNDKRYVLFEFASDPFCGFEKGMFTGKALEIMGRYDLNVNILTKNPKYALYLKAPCFRSDLPWKVGTTITTIDTYNLELIEPGAPFPTERMKALKRISEIGVYTWISLEPLLYPDEALDCVEKTRDFVKEYRIGPLNHSKSKPDIDYTQFKAEVESLVSGREIKLYWKKDYLQKLEGN